MPLKILLKIPEDLNLAQCNPFFRTDLFVIGQFGASVFLFIVK